MSNTRIHIPRTLDSDLGLRVHVMVHLATPLRAEALSPQTEVRAGP